MKKRNLSYLAYIVMLLFPLLVVLCSSGTVSVAEVLGSLPHFTFFDDIFAYFNISSVWLSYMLNYLSYLLLCAFCKTLFFAVTYLLDITDRFLRKEY